MKIKNWFFNILLISLLLINGCASNEIETVETTKTPLKGEILVWAAVPLGLTERQSAYFQEVVNDATMQFDKLNPDVTVSLKFVLPDHLQKLELSIQTTF